MFANLSAEMARKRITIKVLSGLTGIKYESLKNKIAGKTEFKRNEMFLIKKNVFLTGLEARSLRSIYTHCCCCCC